MTQGMVIGVLVWGVASVVLLWLLYRVARTVDEREDDR